MTVIILERVSASLRGELTRWLLEPRSGVFVGRVSAAVRERLWKKVCDAAKGGGAMLLHHVATEQGFELLTNGRSGRVVREFEGLQLITMPDGTWKRTDAD